MPAWLDENLRVYRIAKITGWTIEEIERVPAARLDVLIEIDNAFEEARNQSREI